jgi:hypothetical protein
MFPGDAGGVQASLKGFPTSRVDGAAKGGNSPTVSDHAHHQEDVPVTVRSRWLASTLAFILGTSAAGAAEPPHALAPGSLLPDTAANNNQMMADRIAAQVRQSGQLHHYSVEIQFADGTAELSGAVDDQPQHEEVLRLVQGLPGVQRVRDRITVRNASQPVRTVQAAVPGGPVLPQPVPEAARQGLLPEPQAVFQPGPVGPTDLNPPRMPPYAWPTYAPYNNYSRVAMPQAYPYNAWPFIGPAYPFPKVPLGWRSVKLEWDDGYWWFSTLATRYDWWRMRFY